MKSIKKFSNFETNEKLTPAEEGEAAVKRDDYLRDNPVDEVTLNLRAFTDDALEELAMMLENQSDLIDDETNREAIETIEKFRNVNK